MAQLSLRLVFVATSSWTSFVSSNPRFLVCTGEGGGREMAQGHGIDAVVLGTVERGAVVVLSPSASSSPSSSHRSQCFEEEKGLDNVSTDECTEMQYAVQLNQCRCWMCIRGWSLLDGLA